MQIKLITASLAAWAVSGALATPVPAAVAEADPVLMARAEQAEQAEQAKQGAQANQNGQWWPGGVGYAAGYGYGYGGGYGRRQCWNGWQYVWC